MIVGTTSRIAARPSPDPSTAVPLWTTDPVRQMRAPLLIVLGLAAHSALTTEHSAQMDETSTASVEEVVVTGEPMERGKPPEFEFLIHVYDSRRDGAKLYKEGRYEEAFPLLLHAAKRGFKMAQARVSYLYERGLGTPRDPIAAIGFLGTAAKPPTHPEIRNRFKEIWRRVPPEHETRLREVIDRYDAQYGTRANRIVCDVSHRGGTYMRTLSCNFMDECSLYDHLAAWVPELRSCPRFQL